MKNLDLSTLPAKKRKQIVSCLRAGIQLLYFLFLPSVFTAAFNGVKYIFTQLGQGEKIEMTAFVSALLLVCAFTIVFGRFFRKQEEQARGMSFPCCVREISDFPLIFQALFFWC